MAGKRGSADFDILLVDGYNLLPAKVQNVTHKIEALAQRSDGLGDNLEANSPTGLSRATLTQAGAFFDDSANGAHALLSAAGATGVSRLLVFGQTGNVIGARYTGAEGTFANVYDVLAQVGKLTLADVMYVVSGVIDRGLIIEALVQKTISWNTFTDGFPVDFTLDTAQRVIPITSNTIANPTIVLTPVPHSLVTGQVVLVSGVVTSTPTINGQQTVTVIDATHFSVPVNVTVAGTGGSFVLGSSTVGGFGVLEVSEMTGPTGFIGKIRSSADNITYADLVTFANVTAAPAAQRLAVAGTIARYLCFSGAVTGAGTLTVFSGFSRS